MAVTDWTTAYRNAAMAAQTPVYAPTFPIHYPFINLEDIQGIATDNNVGVVMCVTENDIYRCKLLVYKLVSYYKNRLIGEGADIYVGRVITGKEKIVKVIFYNDSREYDQLHDVTIALVPSTDYPYYVFADLSLNGTTWSKSITYTGPQLHSLDSGNTPNSFEFYAKVAITSPMPDPKPVLVRVSATKVVL